MTSGRATPAPGQLTRRALLLLGTSLGGLLAGAAFAGPAFAGPAPFSRAWYAAKEANGPAASAAIANAVAGSGINSRAYAQVRQSLANLQHSAAAIAAMRTFQSQAHAIAGRSSVPDGLQIGGVVPDSGLAAAGIANPVSSWRGAQAPVQTGPASNPTVTVRQTAQSALLNWRTLNVGRHTRLAFDQSAGGAAAPTWVALNRVRDPTLAPSQILGQVTAQGHVIVVNGSGIIFAPTAEVTVGSLIASTADISNAQFAARGIYSPDSRTPTFTGAAAPVIVEPGAQITTSQPITATSAGGGVILLGSDVTTAGNIQTPDGQTILAAGHDFVLQQGYGVSASGQTVGGLSNALEGNLPGTAGFGPGGTIVETVQGSAIAVADGGTVANTGLIEATTGDVTLVGQTVTQAGDIAATTSVATRGTIHLLTDQTDVKSSVTLAPGSVTTILPDPNSNTALDAQRATDVTSSANANILRSGNGALPLNDQPALPDNQYQSLIQIVSGNNVDVGAGSLAMSQGGQIQIAAPGRVLVEPGASLDVSGAVGVSLPMSANQVAVNVQGFELRDNPLNRDTGQLNNANVYLDARTLVTVPANATAYANSPYDGASRLYSPSGLFEVSGEVSNVTHTIGEWTSAAGTILVSGGASGQFVAEPGSILNLAGGSIDYQAGALKLTWLIGPGGRLYNAATAPADLTYSGVYSGFTVSHPRWSITQTYNDPGITPTSVNLPGYVEGRDGGTLALNEATVVLNGTVDAGVIDGPLQSQPHLATTGNDPYLEPQNAVPLPGQILIGTYGILTGGSAGLFGGYDTAVTFQAGAKPLPPDFGLATKLPATTVDTAILDATALDASGLGGLSIATAGPITVAAPLTLAPAATLALHGATVAVDADIAVPSGAVSLGDVLSIPGVSLAATGGFSLVPTTTVNGATVQTETASVSVAPGVAVDLRGTWTNLLADPVGVAGAASSNGGSLTVDTTGAIALGPGSLVDVSSGAVVNPSGNLTGGIGGSVTLIGDDPTGNPAYDTRAAAPTLPVALAGTIRDLNLSGNDGSTSPAVNALTLRAPGVLIASSAPPTGLDANGRTVLTPAFFQAGFSNYVIDGYGNLPLPKGTTGSAASVAATNLPGVEIAGVAVDPAVPVYLPTAASLVAPTGSNPETAAGLYLPPLYLQNQTIATLAPRQGASLTLASRTFSPEFGPGSPTVPLDGGGDIAIDPGASIRVDPSRSVTLEAVGQITVDGDITAPGGSITLQNDTYESGMGSQQPAFYNPDLSVWIGGQAVLDANGVAQSAVDEFGRSYGLAPPGGTITIGGAESVSSGGFPISTDATVVIRPGAVVEASGSSTSTDLFAGSGVGTRPDIVPLFGNGGSISINSTSGALLDGSLRAFAGGPAAAGGSLELDLVTPVYGVSSTGILAGVPDSLIRQREIVVSQMRPPAVLPADQMPGQSVAAAFGTLRFGADQVAAGGFANLTLAGSAFAAFGPTDVRFDGNVSLSLSQSLDLPATLTDTSTTGVVALRAPYVTLNSNAALDLFSIGQTSFGGARGLQQAVLDPVTLDGAQLSNASGLGANVSAIATGSALSIAAGQLSIGNGEVAGVRVISSLNLTNGTGPSTIFDQPGFASASLSSTGDTQVAGSFVGGTTLTLAAAQIYPVVANALIAVPLDTGATAAGSAAPGTLTLLRAPGTNPVPPLIAGNSLSLLGGDIEQGGIVRAPLGVLNLGDYGNPILNSPGATPTNPQLPNIVPSGGTDRVEFLPDSLTSVSAAGQTILYGGTQDGINYQVNGSAAAASFTPAIVTAAPSVAIDAGATLDLRGGGTLAGAGFNSGRGGSTDALAAPLLQFDGGTATLPNDAVYSIVPSFAGPTQQAPALAFGYASNVAPPSGEQVSIGAGVPGLPAGTYTLQPAYDALLPGAWRVELQPGTRVLAGAASAVGNLSRLVAGTLGTAGTAISGTQPIGVLVTSGANVRRLSSYDEQDYTSFVLSQAQLFGYQRAFIPADAGTLVLNYNVPIPALPPASDLSVEGSSLFAPGPAGFGGSVVVAASSSAGANYSEIDIVGDGPQPAPVAGAIAIPASALDRLGPETLAIGAPLNRQSGQPASPALADLVLADNSSTEPDQVVVESGATLSAPQVLLAALGDVTVATGGSINTLGQTTPRFDSNSGFVYSNNDLNTPSVPALVLVSNGQIVFAPPGPTTAGTVTIANGATLVGRGTVGIDTGGSVSIGDSAIIAARRLSFAVSAVNVTPAFGVPAGDVAPTGLDLSQAKLDALEAGGIVAGAPALQQVSLLASSSINFFGNVRFSLGGTGAQTLEFQTPSIYGVGSPGDVAAIAAGTFIWNGLAIGNGGTGGNVVSAAPAPVQTSGPGTGEGSLVVDASNIVLGYAPGEIASTQTVGARPSLGRNIYGFGSVTLNASAGVTANNAGTLSVYETQGAYANGGYADTGGDLSISAPLLTTAAGALLQIGAGGAISLASSGGITGAAAGLGGEIDLSGKSIDLATSVALPEGKLSLKADGNIALGAGGIVNLAGSNTSFFDQTVAGPGGVFVAESTTGNVTTDPASRIDVSSPGAPAGMIDITATGGNVSLAGAVSGSGVTSGPTSGALDVRAGTLTDFAGLNQRLTQGGLTGSRSFEIASGDLTVESADLVRASNVGISLDSGSLTVDGLIDASGAAPGNISLSAGKNLTLTANAVLDAHGTVPQNDSLGNSIDAENTGSVTLRVADGPNGTNLAATGANGTLTLSPGARLDVSAPIGVTCALGPCGEIEIDVPRVGAADGTNGDLAISAPGPVTIAGAGSIAVDGFWSYAPADGVIVQTNTGADADPKGIGLDSIDAANKAFIASALPGGALNTTLAGDLAGLASYASAFHLRPGVEIDSSKASGGDLTVVGDLDLSSLRYASLNASTRLTSAYGSGEPGVLVLRAANDLNVYGSITDGFAPPLDPPATQNPDDSGWVLQSSLTTGAATQQNIIVPTGADAIDVGGSTFTTSMQVNYALPLAPATLPAGTVLPTSITLQNPLAVPAGGVVAQGNVVAADGTTVLYAKGSTIPGGTMLPANTTLDAGFVLFAGTGFAATNAVTGQTQTWPAGASLTAFGANVSLAASAPLQPGDLIPAGATLSFASGASAVNLRQFGTLPNGLTGQGEVYAVSNLLAPGSRSWSVSLVGGADLAASNPASLTPASALAAGGSTGNLVLADTHFVQLQSAPASPALPSPGPQPLGISVIRTGTGSLSLLAGGDVEEASTYGVYTSGTQSPDVTGTAFDQRGVAYTSNDPTEAATPLGAVAGSIYASVDPAYPEGGGNVVVGAQGDLLTTALTYVQGPTNQTSSETGAWLNRQGDGTAGDPGAWWVNFGNYEPLTGASTGLPALVGFAGIGTLGGGNLTIETGGNAGAILAPSNQPPSAPIVTASYPDAAFDSVGTIIDQSLYAVVGSTGRATASGLAVTGGGRLTLSVGGTLDPTSYSVAPSQPTAQSTILSLRGSVSIDAGAIASVNGSVGRASSIDNPYGASVNPGPEIILGDASASIHTRGDLSISTAGDATLEPTLYASPNGATSWFSLFQPSTAIDLYSAGGDISPAYVTVTGATYYPPSLGVVAASGSIFEVPYSSSTSVSNDDLETTPSATGELQFLAARSVIAGQYFGPTLEFGPIIAMSGADPSLLPTVANPAFTGETGAVPSNTTQAAGTLFAFAPDTTTSIVHAGDPQPMRFYAATGDIEDLSTGVYDSSAGRIIGAKAVRISAGNDIVDLNRTATSGLLFNDNRADISTIQAGNDIFYANAQVSGPGLLEVSAGGNIDQTDTGTPSSPDPSTLTSLGYLVDKTVATQNAGAGITVTVGVPAGAIDLSGFARLYFDPANLANPVIALQNQPGKVVRTYQAQLLAFLQARGYTGDAAGALAAFLALPADVQQILVLQEYYAELNQSGHDYADPASRFYRSYLEGMDAIRALFPATDITGQSPASGGNLTLTGNSGITTDFGGSIEIADPFGATTVGVPGPVPGATAGVLTQGAGDIDVYSYGSVLLGQSRIFTTFGGNLLIWLEGNGEINGGQGSKSTIVFTPPNILYDPFADISLSPTVPSTGAGLATLAPVASVPAGNINLISPFGTIDAGEAGIRSSGNINLVALTVLNAANVQAGGKVTGVTVVAAPNTAGITAASAAAGAVQNAARNNLGQTAPQQTPSIITVETVGPGQSGPCDDKNCRR